MHTVTLSIALVTRNRPDWLARCLESWRSQHTQPFEILVSDDSDTPLQDQVKAVADRFGAHYLKGPRKGLYSNRNHVFGACSGSHIMSADDDHTHPPGFLDAVLRSIHRDHDAIWVVSERDPRRPDIAHTIPGELRKNGTVGPPSDTNHSAAIACGSTVYPRRVFDLGHRCDESYSFGGVWYLWGCTLKSLGFRIRYCDETFCWHHTESSLDRSNDLKWAKAQIECSLFVQMRHALRFSNHPMAIARAIYIPAKAVLIGLQIHGADRRIRITLPALLRAARMAIAR